MYTADGFCKEELFELPKSQFHCVGPLVDKSEKVIVIGLQPDVKLALKSAIGACAYVVVLRLSTKQTPSNALTLFSMLLPIC